MPGKPFLTGARYDFAVTDLLIIAAPLLALAALWCVWRAGHLLLSWRPASAQVSKSGYSDLDRQEDFWIRNPLLTTRGWNWSDGEDSRMIEDEIRFTDAGGTDRVATVRRRVIAGWRPDGLFIIWYDPAHPERVTAFGPFYWLAMALFWCGALALLFIYGANLTGGKG